MDLTVKQGHDQPGGTAPSADADYGQCDSSPPLDDSLATKAGERRVAPTDEASATQPPMD
jgi:hypothetical protein